MYDWESAPLVKVGFSRLSFYFGVYLDVIYYCFWLQLILTAYSPQAWHQNNTILLSTAENRTIA